jgi:hypothetical protein
MACNGRWHDGLFFYNDVGNETCAYCAYKIKNYDDLEQLVEGYRRALENATARLDVYIKKVALLSGVGQ